MLDPVAFAVGGLYRKNPGYIFYTGFIAAIDAVLPFASILLLRGIIEIITTSADTGAAARCALYLLLCNVVLRAARTLFKWRKDIHYGKAMDAVCVSNAQKFMNIDYERLSNTGFLNNARNILTTEFIGVNTVEYACSAVCALLALTGNIAILADLNPLLIPVIFAFILVSTAAQKRAMSKNKEYDIESAQTKRVSEYLHSVTLDKKAVKEMKVFRLNSFFMNRLDKADGDELAYTRKKQNALMYAGGFGIILQAFQTGLLYAYMAYAFSSGKIAIDAFSMYLGMAANFGQNVSLLMKSVANIAMQNEWLTLYRDYHNLPDTRCKHAGAATGGVEAAAAPYRPVPAAASIEFKDVWFRYPGAENYSLRGISFFAASGTTTSIVGLNGAGKTTLVMLLCRLYEPEKGAIFVGGTDIKSIPYEEYTRYISMVFQDFQLFGITIRDNLDCYAAKNDADINDALAKSGILDKVETLPDGMYTRLFKGNGWDGCELSQGERQKLAIARAFVKQSPVVILDEPTAAIDPLSEDLIFRSFHELTKDRTSIFISHRLSSTKYSDLVLVIDDGQIAESGAHGELILNGGGYAAMYKTQMENYNIKVSLCNNYLYGG